MHIGVVIFPTDTTIQPMALARAVEERGFESLWFPEHSHIPVSRATPWGGREDAPPLPEHYWRTHDQIVALTAAAAVTERIKLGTAISLVAQHDPLWLAKQIASLDVMSGGRAMFGVGYGWNKEEMAHHGVAYTKRRAILREKVLMMKALWTQEEASFQGSHVSLEPSWAWPKPLQKPHPPIIMGGSAGPKTFAAIAEFCDGWMPILGRSAITEKLGQLRAAAEAAGRDPDTIEVGIYGAPPDAAKLEAYAAAGVARVLLAAPSEAPESVLALLDEWAPLVTALDAG